MIDDTDTDKAQRRANQAPNVVFAHPGDDDGWNWAEGMSDRALIEAVESARLVGEVADGIAEAHFTEWKRLLEEDGYVVERVRMADVDEHITIYGAGAGVADLGEDTTHWQQAWDEVGSGEDIARRVIARHPEVSA